MPTVEELATGGGSAGRAAYSDLAVVAARAIVSPRVLAQTAVAVPLTGTVSETVLATTTIAAGTIGANGRLRATFLVSYTDSANAKAVRVRLGGIGGTIFFSTSLTTTGLFRAQCEIANRGVANSQVAGPASGTGGWSTQTVAPQTGTVNTAAAQDLVLTVALANSGETLTLESYVLELLP